MAMFRAQWINQDGSVAKDDEFEWDLQQDPGWSIKDSPRPLWPKYAIDAPYFDIEALQKHVGGWIEVVTIPPRETFHLPMAVIVNEEGRLKDMETVKHQEVSAAQQRYGILVGPVVIVTLTAWGNE